MVILGLMACAVAFSEKLELSYLSTDAVVYTVVVFGVVLVTLRPLMMKLIF